jgi:hypothetical protein
MTPAGLCCRGSGITELRTWVRHRGPSSPTRNGSACGGSPTTGPAMAGRADNPTGVSARQPAMWPRRPARPGPHRGARLSGGAARTRQPVPPCSPVGSRPWRAWPDSRRSEPTGSTGTTACAPRARPPCRPQHWDGRRRRPTRRTPRIRPEFTPADLALLAGEWGWLGGVVEAAGRERPGRCHRRRRGLRHHVGVRCDHRAAADAVGARRAGPGGAQLAQPMAGRSMPDRRTTIVHRGRPRLGSDRRALGSGLAARGPQITGEPASVAVANSA